MYCWPNLCVWGFGWMSHWTASGDDEEYKLKQLVSCAFSDTAFIIIVS